MPPVYPELPSGWAKHSRMLIKRTGHDAAARSVYRIGTQGNTRIMLVELDAKGGC